MKYTHIPGIVVIGWTLILLGILFDDITSHILFSFGFSIAETNPIYQLVQNQTIFIIITIIFYLILFWFWYFLNVVSIKAYEEKQIFYKTRDILIFVGCFIIVFLFIIKLEAGVNNIGQMVTYIQDKDSILDGLDKLNDLKVNDPLRYNQLVQDHYNEVYNIPYWQLVMISILSFLLFRTGYRVVPWGYD